MTIHPLDAQPPSAPEGDGDAARGESSSRLSMSQRIVRGGVWLGVAGFTVTLIGAMLLGNGPSEFEVLGDLVHRGGMILLLGGFIVVLAGYRWETLVTFFQPAVDMAASVSSESRRDIGMRALFDSLPPPAAPVVVAAELAQASPATQRTTDPPRRTGSDDPLSALAPGRDSFDMRTQPPPNRHAWGCLIGAWSVIGIVFATLGLLYWVAPVRVALWLSFLIDLSLVVVSLASAVAWSGRKRAFAIGFSVPLVTMVFAKYPHFQALVLTPWSGAMFGNAPPMWEWRIFEMAFHLLAPLTGGLAWLVVRTLEVLDASQRMRKDESR